MNIAQRSAFATRLKVKPGQVTHLMGLVNQAARAQESEHNTGTDSSSQVNAVETYAKSLGFGCLWPGLYPVLTKNDDEIHLPD